MSLINERMSLYNELIKQSSNTPLLELKKLEIPNGNRIFLKLEYRNPVGSLHMRVYPFVFQHAEKLGFITPFETPVIEASFGNAGIAFTYCANFLGYNSPFPPKVVVPSNISASRLNQLQNLNADLIFSPADKFNLGYVEFLEKELENDKQIKGSKTRVDTKRLYPIIKTRKNAKFPYKNLVDEANFQIKELGLTSFDYFVGIIGSGTSISGIGERLKELNSMSKVIVAEPSSFRNSSSLMSNGIPLPISNVPKNFPYVTAIGVPLSRLNLNQNVIDDIVQYDLSEIQQLADKIENMCNVSLGLTTLGSISCAIELCKNLANKTFLICAYDEAKNWN